MNLISREEVRDLMYHNRSPLTEYDLDTIPSIDTSPVVYGYWIIKKFGADAQCSNCKRYFKDVYDMENSDHYCRHCGAKMEGLRTK